MEKFISSSDLAILLKLTPQRVNQLAKENILKREVDGKFNTANSLEAYYAFKFKANEELNYQREHTKLERAKREKAEIELERLKNSLLYATEVEEAMATMIKTVKTRFLPIPERIAPRILGQRSLPIITEVIRGEIYEALNELKEMPVEKPGVDN